VIVTESVGCMRVIHDSTVVWSVYNCCGDRILLETSLPPKYCIIVLK
jgi:hypothetical protein